MLRAGSTSPHDSWSLYSRLIDCAVADLFKKDSIEIFSRVLSEVSENDPLWNGFLSLCQTHGMASILSRFIVRTCPQLLLGNSNRSRALKSLEEDAKKAKENSLLFQVELGRVAATLQKHGIDFLLYKGPELERRLYGESGLRPYNDLDFYISPGDLQKTVQVLIKDSWSLGLELQDRQLRSYRLAESEISLISHYTNIPLELHWHLCYRARSNSQVSELMLKRRQEMAFGDCSVPVLSPEDLFIVLNLHAWKHHWGSQRISLDLALLLFRYPSLDFDYIESQLTRLNAKSSLWQSLQVMNKLYGHLLPERCSERIFLSANSLKMTASYASKSTDRILSHHTLGGGVTSKGLSKVRGRIECHQRQKVK